MNESGRILLDRIPSKGDLAGRDGDDEEVKFSFAEAARRDWYAFYTYRDKLIKKAAKRGNLAIVKFIVEETAAPASIQLYHSVSGAALDAAFSGHAEVVQYLLLKRRDMFDLRVPESAQFYTNLTSNAAASGNLDLVAWIHRDPLAVMAHASPGLDARDALAYSYSYASVHGHVHVLDWLWDSGKCRLEPVDMTKAILGELPPSEETAPKRIRALDWARNKGLLYITGEIASAAAQGGSVTVFKWLFEQGDVRVPRFQVAKSAVSRRHLDLLNLLAADTKDGGRRAVMNPIIIEDAVRFGHIDIARWLIDEHLIDSPVYSLRTFGSLPAIAFECGRLDFLRFFYEDLCIPYGTRPSRIHARAKDFFREHASDWEAGVFPSSTVKPALGASEDDE